MNGIALERNAELHLLLSSACRRGDPETAALAKALANGSRALDLTSLEQLSERILAGGDDILITWLIAYCVSNSIMFDPEWLNRHQPKGWRKLLAWVQQRFIGVQPKPVWRVSVFGDGEKEGDTIS